METAHIALGALASVSSFLCGGHQPSLAPPGAQGPQPDAGGAADLDVGSDSRMFGLGLDLSQHFLDQFTAVDGAR